jgi:cobalamin biosynthesis protein CbiG
MGMEIGARKLEGKCYNLVSEEPFKNIDFIDGTDLRCTQFIRRVLSDSGIDFSTIDGFKAIKADEVPLLLEKVKKIDFEMFSDEYEQYVILTKFLKICIANNFDVTIG